MQEEGYEAALECNGMTLDQTQLKVEPCISAGPKAKRKGAGQAAADGGQHRDSAPKACFPTLDNDPQAALGILQAPIGCPLCSFLGCCRSGQHLIAMPEAGQYHMQSAASTLDLEPFDQMLRLHCGWGAGGRLQCCIYWEHSI